MFGRFFTKAIPAPEPNPAFHTLGKALDFLYEENQRILKRLEILEAKPFKVEILKRGKPQKMVKKK